MKISSLPHGCVGITADRLHILNWFELAANRDLAGVEVMDQWVMQGLMERTDRVLMRQIEQKLAPAAAGRLEVSAFINHGPHVWRADDKNRLELDKARFFMDWAQALGSKIFRVTTAAVGDNPLPDDEARVVFIRMIEELLPDAAQRNLVIALEEHPGFAGTVAKMERIVERIPDRRFGIAFDMKNTLREGENPLVLLDKRTVLNRVLYTHVDNFKRVPSGGRDRGVQPVGEGWWDRSVRMLPPRGEQYWDGRMTVNPAIRKCGGTYVLFYLGSTFQGRIPEPPEMNEQWAKDQGQSSFMNTRIGIATAPSVRGPWTRRDQPILWPRPDSWDAHNTSNPAPCLYDDGRVLMVYRSSSWKHNGNLLGVAGADHYTKPFRRLRDEPVLYGQAGNDYAVEDPFIWWNGCEYELLAKDLRGTIGGEQYTGVHAHSPNGLDWTFSKPAKAYSRTVRWDDGTTTEQSTLDRPSLLIENGVATHLTLATSDGAPGRPASRTWVMVVPLKTK